MKRSRSSPCVPAGEKQSALAEKRSEKRPRILVVDDEAVIADTITRILARQGFAATAAYDGECAMESALLAPPHLLLTNVILPGMNGIELAATIRRVYPDCKVLFFTGRASSYALAAPAAHAGGRFAVLNKRLPPQALLDLVARHLDPASEMPAVA